jgi:hypothetical protein
MTFTQLITSINTLLTRVGADRLSSDDIRTVCLNIANFFGTQIVDSLPNWDGTLTFQTDGTDSGQYCIYEDTNGRKRIWQTKVDDNTNNLPPSNPSTNENTLWEEVSSSAFSSIQEWTPGLYGPSLVIVFHDHSTEGKGLYMLVEAARPYASSDIEAEALAGDWERLTNKKKFRGGWPSDDTLPVNSDNVGSGPGGDLESGDEWYLSNALGADIDAGDGSGVQHWNQYAMIKYLAPGIWKIWQ